MARIFAIALPLLLIAIAPPASADDAADCAYMSAMVAVNNQGAPRMIDSITRSDGGTHDCASKSANFNWSVLLSVGDMAPDWQDILKATLQANICTEARIGELVRTGWKLTASWTTQDGEIFATDITCP